MMEFHASSFTGLVCGSVFTVGVRYSVLGAEVFFRFLSFCDKSLFFFFAPFFTSLLNIIFVFQFSFLLLIAVDLFPFLYQHPRVTRESSLVTCLPFPRISPVVFDGDPVFFERCFFTLFRTSNLVVVFFFRVRAKVTWSCSIDVSPVENPPPPPEKRARVGFSPRKSGSSIEFHPMKK